MPKVELDSTKEHSQSFDPMKTGNQGDLPSQAGLSQSDVKRMDFDPMKGTDNPGVPTGGEPYGKSGGGSKHMTSEFSSMKTGNEQLIKVYKK